MRPSAFVTILVLGVPLSAARVGDPGDETSRTTPSVLQRLELPPRPGETLTVTVAIDGRPRVLDLWRASVRSAGFEVRVPGPDGALVAVEPPPPATFRGRLLDDPGSVVAAALVPGGLVASIVGGDGSAWFVEPASSVAAARGGAWHAVSANPGFAPALCGAMAPPAPRGTGGAAAAGAGPACLRVAEIALDVDFEYFQLSGSSVPATIQNVEAVLNAVNAIYARELAIEHRVSQLVVRSSEPDPYTASDPGGLLDEFRNHWNSVLSGVPRDTAHLITGRDMSGGIIGLAFVTVICNKPWAYGLSQFTFSFATHVNVLAHELGHNWSAPHCLDSSFCGLMCGGCVQGFGPTTQELILEYASGLACLDADPGFVPPVPPTARDDDAIAVGPLTIDVLANDLDGNCDPLTIDSFDATAALGGQVQLSPGTGPGGRDELSYTPPPGFDGIDTFNYTTGDGVGGQDSATVSVFDDDPDLVAHWRMDEGLGFVAFDSSGRGHHGAYFGPILGGLGAASGTGASIDLDGLDDYVIVGDGAGLSELTRNFTVAAWVRRESATGIRRIAGNPQSWAFGVNASGLTLITPQLKDYIATHPVPVGTWTHVAAVFDLECDVSFYVSGQLVAHAAGSIHPGAPGPSWYLGSLDGSGQFLQGGLDEVQLWDGAMTDDQVACLFRDAVAPGLVGIPFTGSLGAGATQELTLCALTSGHGGDLYFLLGSISGTAPGVTAGGVHLPLNPDIYFNLTVINPNRPPLSDSFGYLSASGLASARFVLPPGFGPALVGTFINHAFAILDPATMAVEDASNPTLFVLVP